MEDNQIVEYQSSEITISNIQPFTVLTLLVKKTVNANSWRVYNETYKSWLQWCEHRNIDALDMTPDNLTAFLIDASNSHATRKRMLSNMRQIAQYAPVNLENLMQSQVIKKMRVPEDGLEETENEGRALSPDEFRRVLSVWTGTSALTVRNRAIVATLFSTWIRRFEAANLRWSDIDLDKGKAVIRRGKGNKRRTVAFIGDYAITALRHWRTVQGSGREFVFCPVNGRKIGDDKPITPSTIYKMVQRTAKISGVDWSPHDARRSGITEWLQTGGNMPDAQAQAGHKHGHMVLHYAEGVDAESRRRKARSRFTD